MIAETPTQEHALIIQAVLEGYGYTVGDKDDFKADVTLNIMELNRAILVGSVRDDKSWCMVWGDGQKIEIDGHTFNLADPNSHIKIGEELLRLMNAPLPHAFHFVP